MDTPKCGDYLPNGSLILLAKPSIVTREGDMEGFVVLAQHIGGGNGPELVTWSTDKDLGCYSGHYFQLGLDSGLKEALADFDKRTS